MSHGWACIMMLNSGWWMLMVGVEDHQFQLFVITWGEPSCLMPRISEMLGITSEFTCRQPSSQLVPYGLVTDHFNERQEFNLPADQPRAVHQPATAPMTIPAAVCWWLSVVLGHLGMWLNNQLNHTGTTNNHDQPNRMPVVRWLFLLSVALRSLSCCCSMSRPI